MISEANQVLALQQAIIERAHQFSKEHIARGKMTSNKIIQDAREKIKLMEQKELLSAKIHADREYKRLVQASELRIQAELDRDRWNLVQAVMENITRHLFELHNDKRRYQPVFERFLGQGAAQMAQHRLLASINEVDISRFARHWRELVKASCEGDVNITLLPDPIQCSGGVILKSEAGDVMVDNTFDGIISRRKEALQRLIFNRLFSSVSNIGTVFYG